MLIILDNLWSTAQREALLPPQLRLPRGSIVVMTSRNVDVLFHEHYSVRQELVGGLLKNEATKLLCSHAFALPNYAGGHGAEDSSAAADVALQKEDVGIRIISDIVEACHGVPLALAVTGKYLHGKSIEDWQVSKLLSTH